MDLRVGSSSSYFEAVDPRGIYTDVLQTGKRYRRPACSTSGDNVSAPIPLVCIPVGVVLERRKATSPWGNVVWLPIAVFAGVPDTDPWTPLTTEGETITYYAGAAEIELYRTETDNYLNNLASASPSVWVALHATGGEPPYDIAAVTADPTEGEALTEPGQGIVEAVDMPNKVRDVIASFITEHHVGRSFEKRKRDRVDPEALARRGPLYGNKDDR